MTLKHKLSISICHDREIIMGIATVSMNFKHELSISI